MIPKFRSWVENVRHPNYSFMQYEPEFNGEINKIFEKNGEIQHGVKINYMQSTGLKDKNGVEIFEGDLVQAERGEIGYIAYLLQEAGFVVVLKNSDYRLGHRNTGEPYDTAVRHEVIGNIYENPELLENGE